MHWSQQADPAAIGLERAFEKSRISLTLADMTLPDAPLIGVNDGFCEMTGYEPEHALDRNCRFLQPSGGAGPVRARMRQFLTDETVEEEKFVVPNVTRSGGEFLNLVYMTKLKRGGKVTYVLGSQFNISGKSANAVDMFDQALKQDIVNIGSLAGEHGMIVLGTYQSLASSHSLIAKTRVGQAESRQ
ncbi:PAS domain-containing protein [Qipengyuania atrilutea]|uniref:PAS domain-containing protein n=1 Tax=Qipengyuania atrilutea TaxID=2744473 RepID=A0A850H1I5_9SPHN|nr:PAS domain-containing protein [Actirhodobacter atriluteus]NVD44546.1 PAS domain-containing protein [Actirhodobacter atriluteus]